MRRELADKETLLSARTPEKEKSADDELSWLDMLSHDINDNVEERINLQKALFELEDMNLHNRAELQRLDELIAESVSPFQLPSKPLVLKVIVISWHAHPYEHVLVFVPKLTVRRRWHQREVADCHYHACGVDCYKVRTAV